MLRWWRLNQILYNNKDRYNQKQAPEEDMMYQMQRSQRGQKKFWTVLKWCTSSEKMQNENHTQVSSDVMFIPWQAKSAVINNALLLLSVFVWFLLCNTMLVRYMLWPGVCLCVTSRWFTKHINGLSWYLAWMLPLTYPTLCYKEVRVTLNSRLSPQQVDHS